MSDDDKSQPAGDTTPPAHKTRVGVKIFATIGVIVVVLALVAGTVAAIVIHNGDKTKEQAQEALEPFYTPPANIPAKPGTVIRVEPINNVTLPNGKAYRVLYTTLDKDNKPAAASGQFWVSTKPVPAGGRRVLAWAHGTVGTAPKCAPSRSANPLQDTSYWLNVAMDNGYVVAATDYLGLGTPYPPTYLVGRQEARDVVNSVRAVKNFVKEPTTKDWIVYGHSQGGHSALWTAALSKQLAPELNLIATGAAAPAQQLEVIMQNQWNTAIGWVIGPEALVSFENAYPGRNFRGILSDVASDRLDSLLQQCIAGAGIQGMAINKAGGNFFTTDPITSPAWAKTGLEETPPILPASMPLFMSEGTNDDIVLSGSNALMQVKWCAAGSDMTTQWQGGITHLQVATVGGPTFMEWAQGQFAGKNPPRNCEYPPAVKPLPEVKVPPQVLAAPMTVATVDVPVNYPTPSASN